MKRSELGTLECPLARALDVVADAWTLLVLRDAMFFSCTRFEDFRARAAIPTNVLSDRLRRLVDHGVLERRHAPRGNSLHEYRLTAKGEQLWSALTGLLAWGNRWTTHPEAPPLRAIHTDCGADLTPPPECPSCAAPVSADNLRFAPAQP